MNNKHINKPLVYVSLLTAVLMFFIFANSGLAASFVTHVSGPNWTGTQYTFLADSDTAFGQGVAIELHDLVNNTYHKYACTYDSDQGGGVYRYSCTANAVLGDGTSANDVEFQYFVCDYGSTSSNCGNYTGFGNAFNTSPTTAITLRSLSASVAGAPAALPLLAGVIGLAGLGLGVGAYARRQRR